MMRFNVKSFVPSVVGLAVHTATELLEHSEVVELASEIAVAIMAIISVIEAGKGLYKAILTIVEKLKERVKK